MKRELVETGKRCVMKIEKANICPYWMEEDVELCEASGKKCYCGANLWYCDFPQSRKKKENKDE